MKNFLLVALLALLPSYSFTQDNSGPEAAMLEYATATKAWNVEHMAALMHPEALQRVRETFDRAFRGENADKARADLLPLFSTSTYDEFSALVDIEVYERMTASVAAAAPELIELMSVAEYEIVGQIQREGEVFLTYVLLLPIEGQTLRQEVVQRLKQHEGQWRLMLPPDGEATIAAIEAQY